MYHYVRIYCVPSLTNTILVFDTVFVLFGIHALANNIRQYFQHCHMYVLAFAFSYSLFGHKFIYCCIADTYIPLSVCFFIVISTCNIFLCPLASIIEVFKTVISFCFDNVNSAWQAYTVYGGYSSTV